MSSKLGSAKSAALDEIKPYNCCTQFNTQLRVIMWKNAVLKLRSWYIIIAELGIPIIFMLALYGIRGAITEETKDLFYPSIPVPTESFRQMYFDPPCSGENLLWRCNSEERRPNCSMGQLCQSKKIAVAPSNKDSIQTAQNFASYALLHLDGLKAKSMQSDDYVTYFESEQAFIDVISSGSYSRDESIDLYSAAVIFTSGPPAWDYTVRLNSSFTAQEISGRNGNGGIPRTDSPALDETILYGEQIPGANSSWAPYLVEYNEIGYFTLTNLVDSFIATHSCRLSGKCTSTEEVDLGVAGILEFPNKDVRTNGFWSLIGFIFGLFIILALLYPIANVISALVQEKETKIREGMTMMSLRNDVLWLSWWLHNLFLFLPMAILLTIVGSTLFVYSDSSLVFAWFFLFFLASISYSIAVSTIFNTSKTASIIGSLVYFAGFFIYLGLSFSPQSRASYMAASLHPSACFIFGTLAFIEYEDSQIGVTSFTAGKSSLYPITFSDTLGMLILDAIYLLIVGWYLANVLPSQYGTPKPWYFVFQTNYWCPSRTGHASQMENLPQDDDENCPVEEVTQNLSNQIAKNMCVDIRGLKKEFQTNTGTKLAVDGLNLTMFSGQITALLGHNGAGKSTAISMLTGLLPIDGGKATIEGLDVATDMHTIRSIIGVCPQHDILFPNLTVEEHLSMFASFKDTPRDRIKEEVERMIQSVGLTEKRKAYSKTLSGGQKRKLSVGIAFIGDSRVVFLDEPTSGMDPYSRRFTWNVIRQHREGRIVVLTTHFMDEADLLGDRIAIMGDGKLRCCGSSLFLKQKFGVGYNMTLEKLDANSFDSHLLGSMVTSAIPAAKLLTDVGTEISYQLPFDSSNKFQELFEAFDSKLEALGLRSYGMSVTTLEEVFLKVAEGTHTLATANDGKYKRLSRDIARESNPTPAPAVDPESGDKFNVPFQKVSDDNILEMFRVHFKVMLLKRFLYFKRDWKAWAFQFFIPIIFVLIGVIIQVISNEITGQPTMTLNIDVYNTDINSNYLPLPYTNRSQFSYFDIEDISNPISTVGDQDYLMSFTKDATDLPIIPITRSNNSQYQTPQDMSYYLLDHREDFEASKFGAYSIGKTERNGTNGIFNLRYFLHGNYTAIHAGPIFSNVMANTLVRSYDTVYSITTRLNPFDLTKAEETDINQISVFFLVSFIMIAMPFSPAAFAVFVVRERELKSKYQQMVSGVSVYAYWISTWIWDNISFQLSIWLIILIIGCAPGTETIASPHDGALGTTIGLFIFYGMAVTPFTYLICFFFRTATSAQVAVLFIVLLIGLGLGIAGVFLRIIESTRDAYKSLRYLFMLCPPFAFGEGLFNMAYIDLFSQLDLGFGKSYKPSDLGIAGLNMIFLIWTSFVYLALVILIEYGIAMPSIQAKFVNRKIPTDNTIRDEDVLEEEKRIKDHSADDSTIVINDVKKVYPGGKYAVRGVSVAIPNGECFGLLGINGAGKSTTLSMLTGEIPPTSGNISLNGMDLLTDIHKCRRYIGYCPQFDALFELLTGREHLALYASIKGIVAADVDAVVNSKIAEMGLTEYADRAAGTYSGGNKRKLSVAMAMIGEPSIVFLDEPSTGMDPVARRFMWDVISDIVTKREKCCLILTTHSMEECEALCTRIGIMVGGVLRCLGSGQRLRSRYGLGFQIELVLRLPSAEETDAKLQQIVQICPAQNGANPMQEEAQYRREHLTTIFNGLGNSKWIEQINATGTGSDISTALDTTEYVLATHLTSWVILEEAYDKICGFLQTNFSGYVLRERQTVRIRIEIPSVLPDGGCLKLSTIFGVMEKHKEELRIQDYSVGQTSLEQIFNQFASQQEEETGKVIH
mmetsp:Transcript_30098/g.30579  ORF Transcript_30098/g.30579 Transcript_30098/m.30579 type:complete len:1840 (-) Transcript_30098:237-5756(-)